MLEIFEIIQKFFKKFSLDSQERSFWPQPSKRDSRYFRPFGRCKQGCKTVSILLSVSKNNGIGIGIDISFDISKEKMNKYAFSELMI